MKKAAKREAELEAIRAEKLAILAKIESEQAEVVLESLNYGNVEVWNYILCYRQNAESDGNDLIAHVECALSCDNESVQSFFRKHGFSF